MRENEHCISTCGCQRTTSVLLCCVLPHSFGTGSLTKPRPHWFGSGQQVLAILILLHASRFVETGTHRCTQLFTWLPGSQAQVTPESVYPIITWSLSKVARLGTASPHSALFLWGHDSLIGISVVPVPTLHLLPDKQSGLRN